MPFIPSSGILRVVCGKSTLLAFGGRVSGRARNAVTMPTSATRLAVRHGRRWRQGRASGDALSGFSELCPVLHTCRNPIEPTKYLYSHRSTAWSHTPYITWLLPWGGGMPGFFWKPRMNQYPIVKELVYTPGARGKIELL